MSEKWNRRAFLRGAAATGAALTLGGVVKAATTGDVSEESKIRNSIKSEANPLRIGFIGVGLRGQGHLSLALDRKDCVVTAIADIDPDMIKRSKAIIEKKGGKPVEVYDKGENDYLNMLKKAPLDAVIIATPWEWHSKMAVAAMKAGKYTGVEVCGAFSVEECWEMVHVHEETGSHLFFLENVCYRRDVMAVLNMVRQGMFGDLIHLEGGYQHDLRNVKFNAATAPHNGVEFGENAFSEAKWRTQHSVSRNGDLYPTHGVGPVANYLNINRGNRFLYLTSISSKAMGLHDYVVNHPKGGENHPNAKVEFALGDVVTTLIKTANGETVTLYHDTNLPRPYSLGFRVQGTKGIWMDVNKSLYIEGVSAKPHQWDAAEAYLTKYDHPLWKKYEAQATGAGHGGMDFFLLHAFVEAAKTNEPAPIDVYDAAVWMAITPLSEQSIAAGSAPQPFPDFTRGGWMKRPVVFALGDQY